MASAVNALVCALAATAFWVTLGYAIARPLLPRPLAQGAAPVIGWAVASAMSLPIFTLIGFSPVTVVGLAAFVFFAGGGSLLPRRSEAAPVAAPTIPAWSYAAAAALALVPAIAILPKFSGGGVHLSDPIFDHSKIAIIDAMVRQGLPPIDPVFAAFGTADRLVYYYLWHFSAAELASALHLSGWEADIALTWFTAFASLTLMMGIATWLSKKSGAAILVVVLAAGTSLRTVLSAFFGSYGLEPFLASPSGFAGWLFQSAWVPQHLMSANCVVAAMLLVVLYSQRQSLVLLLTLALLVVAGFESSSYVGGITFAIAAVASTPILISAVDPDRRFRIISGVALAALLVVIVASPFLLAQFATLAARGVGPPIVIRPFEVLGEMFPATLRRILDLPAYWLVLLPIEFPATFVAGTIGLLAMARAATEKPERTTLAVLIVLAAAGLVASWLLVSTVGDNNDLGLRAVLPAAMVLVIGAAAGVAGAARRSLIVAAAAVGLILCLPDTVAMVRSNYVGTPVADAGVFARSPELWSAVRRHAAPTARIANNPLFLRDLTPWPVNISWALLADRSSCFAGRELALAFAPLPPGRREATNAQFERVFAGQGSADDVDEMAHRFGCDVVVVVPQDGAWSNDPFAASLDYRLAEAREGQWRIYLRIMAAQQSPVHSAAQ